MDEVTTWIIRQYLRLKNLPLVMGHTVPATSNRLAFCTSKTAWKPVEWGASDIQHACIVSHSTGFQAVLDVEAAVVCHAAGVVCPTTVPVLQSEEYSDGPGGHFFHNSAPQSRWRRRRCYRGHTLCCSVCLQPLVLQTATSTGVCLDTCRAYVSLAVVT